MNRIRMCAVLGMAVLALPLLAKQPQTEPAKPTMTAEQVLDKYVEVTGGKAAYDKITSTVTKGKMEIKGQNVSGTVEIYAKAPNKILVKQTIENVGAILQGFDGKVGWAQDPFTPLHTLKGEELASLKRQAAFNEPVKWREVFKKAEMVGIQKVDEKDTYVIRLTGEGKPVTQYYDTNTFLMVRSDSTEESPQGTFSVEAYASDYRAVDGVKVPFALIQKIANVAEASITVTEVKNNVPIADKIFAKPSDQKKPNTPKTPKKKP